MTDLPDTKDVNDLEDGDEPTVMLIYNPTNHLVTPAIIMGILQKCQVNYRPRDLSIFQRGLTHQSYVVITDPSIVYERLGYCVELQPESNERLEYLGDAVIGAIISSYLFHRYQKEDEGFLTKIKTKLVRTNMLAKYSLYLGLNHHMLISKHVEDVCNGRTNERILEDTFEAFMGALFEDIYQNCLDNYGQAMQICSDFLIQLMEDTTDFRPLISVNDNYKELLLQYYHKHWVGIHPIYHEIKIENGSTDDRPQGRKIYTMGVNHPITGQLIGKGCSPKKTQAEQLASKMALDFFEKDAPEPISSSKRSHSRGSLSPNPGSR